MSSYAASARITAASPRLRFGSALLPQESPSHDDERQLAPVADAPSTRSRLVLLADEDDGLDAWLGRVRTAWDQTTWYLFNAEGWR